ncbi:hypothetical protein E2C01_006986 [Portunus trituberculatus]|uniref:Uncharacterized protein n=1 Tax=Portunus trituberculatus TaxID=210409 RepID=A0A5B7CWM2_PORTR|nr:hypothetical protein [Portunus trituberculatus]
MGRKYTLSARPLLVCTVAMFGFISTDSTPSSFMALIAWDPVRQGSVVIKVMVVVVVVVVVAEREEEGSASGCLIFLGYVSSPPVHADSEETSDALTNVAVMACCLWIWTGGGGVVRLASW